MGFNILTIDEYELTNLELSGMLGGMDINIVNVKNELEARKFLDEKGDSIDAVIWAVNNKRVQISDLIEKFKGSGESRNIPVVVVSEVMDRNYIIRAIESGVDEYIVRPFEKETVRRKICRVLNIPYEEPLESKINDILIDDIVSFNFSEMYSREIAAASRGNYPMSIVLVTIVNIDPNRVFQEELNSIISIFKRVIKTRIRNTDTVFQFGSNNLIILLPFSDVEGAEKVEEKINKMFFSHSMIKKKNGSLRLFTASVTYPNDGKIKEKLLAKLREKQDYNTMKS